MWGLGCWDGCITGWANDVGGGGARVGEAATDCICGTWGFVECMCLLGVEGLLVLSGSFLILSILGPGKLVWNPGTFTSLRLCSGSGSGGIISCFTRFCGSIGGVLARL